MISFVICLSVHLSVRPSVRPSVRMEHLRSDWTNVDELYHLSFLFQNAVEKVQV